LPSLEVVLVLIQLSVAAAAARFAWQACDAVRQQRELVEAADDLLRQLREAVVAGDALAAPEAADGAASRQGAARHDAVLGLAKLGLEVGEIADRLQISRGEANLLLKLGDPRAMARRA
jgi:DNA-binding NarL/FixJ family response regulator